MHADEQHPDRSRPAAVRPPQAPPPVNRPAPPPPSPEEWFAGADPSYRALTAPAARLYRLLSLHPAPVLGTTAAAGALGTGPEDAARRLAELAAARLLTADGAGRYRMHRLIRAHAAREAARHEGPSGARAAVRRMAEAYARTAAADPAAERDNLPAVVRLAEEYGLDALVCRLCEAMAPPDPAWAEAYRAGADAAVRRSDVRAEARIRRLLGLSLLASAPTPGERRDPAEAEDELLTSARLARAAGDTTAEAGAVRALAHLRRVQNRPEDAQALTEAARALTSPRPGP